MKQWKTIKSVSVHKNPWSEVVEDSVVRPDGTSGTYYVVKRHPFCGIIPIDENGNINLVQQERYPIRRTGWEIPQGQLDSGEDIAEAAARELAEETGLSADHIEHIGEMAAEKGLQDAFGQIFVATGLHQRDAKDSQSEEGIMDCRAFSLQEIHELLQNGEIQCTFTASALYLAEV